MFKRKPRFCRNGVAAIEFALVAPVFFLLVFAVVELGRMMMIQQSLTNAAREGCRKAVLATTTDSSAVDAAVRQYLQSVLSNTSSDEVRVTVPSNMAAATPGSSLTVAVEVDYADATWVPLGYLGLNPTISASQSGMRE